MASSDQTGGGLTPISGGGTELEAPSQLAMFYAQKHSQSSLDIAASWLELYQTSSTASLLDAIKMQIKLFVPYIYSPKENCDCLNLLYDKEIESQKLITPMELFLSGLQSSDKFYERLSAMEPPATICGRVFKWGEPTYSCRDCGLDPTCVLCVDCFRKSEHTQHKYKISTSHGGGCCDCGDKEAWKLNYYCTDHAPNATNQAEETDAELEDFQNRARVLMTFLLEFCQEILDPDLKASSMPVDLKLQDLEIEAMRISCPSDLYSTVLYNDEVHTFDLVIQTLSKAVECTKDMAKEFATIIDREGRSLVKCSDFQTCERVKQVIEKQTNRNGVKPLKVVVMQAHLFAHQTFAVQILKWINKLISISSQYRLVFAEIMNEEKKAAVRPGFSLLEAVLYNDAKLWIAARSLWHHLSIVGLLKEYENKKNFARVFSKRYPTLMRDFFEDDHDHSVSITSLSVQIFTVPSIAHYLLEQEDIFYKIIHTFMAEYEPKLNADEILEFYRNGNSSSVKRAFYCTVDLQYILSLPPSTWTESLRKGFLHGFGKLLTMLRWMENMDSVVRQTLQHMEYEPDWESGFNLHIKLSSILTSVQDWCGADRTVLIVAYRKVLTELNKVYGNDESTPSHKREFAGWSTYCVDYDVSRQPVSVHKPLSRLFAGLYLRLGTFNLDFDSSPLRFGEDKDDRKDRVRLTPQALIEPALRTQVLLAQVHANMWRRNGFSLLNQVYFYTNVKCRSEMMDKDIVSLQFGAATIESNSFLIQVLDRYGLLSLLSKTVLTLDSGGDDDSTRNSRQLLDELLYLLIVIVSARFSVGIGQVTAQDCVRKEVIQQLCVEPLTHSSLSKALVESSNTETGLDAVLNEVALAKKQPGLSGILKYELKPEFYNEYDCYHYHYSREEQSKAEQAQISRKKAKKEPCCFPPPMLPPFVKNFERVVGILSSDVLLVILASIIRRECTSTQNRRQGESGKDKSIKEDLSHGISDPLMQKTLHLICLGLNEDLLQKDLQSNNFSFLGAAQKHQILPLLDDYFRLSLSSTHNELIRHVFQLCDKLNASLSSERSEAPMEVELSGNNVEQEERRKKAKLAKEAREKMMAQISAAQKSFMAVNADLFDKAVNEISDDSKTSDPSAEVQGIDVDVNPQRQALGHARSSSSTAVDEVHTCILCQEEQHLSDLSRPFVMAAYVQRSSVYCQARAKLISEDTLRKGAFAWQERDPAYLGPDLISVPYLSCCGHMMHVSCWNKHYENVQAKERRRPYRHPASFDVEKREYLCPMCDCISNITLPMTNPLFMVFPGTVNCNNRIPGPFDVWVEALQAVAKERVIQGELCNCAADNRLAKLIEDQRSYGCKYETCSITTVLQKLEHRQEEFEMLSEESHEADCATPNFTENFRELLANFSQMVYAVGLDVKGDAQAQDFRLPLILWQGLAFTIIAQEDFARDQCIPFFGNEVPARKELGVEYLIRSVALGSQQYFASRPEVMKSHAVKLITTMVTSPVELPCILECDAFALLVNLTQVYPAIFGKAEDQYFPLSGSLIDYNICKLGLLLHITQVIITKDFSSAISKTGDSTTDKSGDVSESYRSTPTLSRLEHLVSEVWRASGAPIQEGCTINYDRVWEIVRDAVIPYLRCCCKFYEKLTCVFPSESLHAVNSSYDDLVRFLGLPTTFEGLFDSRVCWQLPYRWASHPRVKKILHPSYTAETIGDSKAVALVTYPRSPLELASLPTDYTELINSVSSFACKSNDRDSRAPTTCVICGITLCSQSYCCQFSLEGATVGACTFHSYFCGAGKGIFLRNRDCKMFYIGGKGKGCNALPPYVDQYGETDQGLKRGNPLFLDCEKYSQLRKSWMLHSLPEEIARFVENSTIFSGTEWQLV